jgi:dihydroxyacid dehydratase/phosphogluconate dehydratase
MMGIVRCNVPGVFVHGGSALPGQVDGRDVNVVNTYEPSARCWPARPRSMTSRR